MSAFKEFIKKLFSSIDYAIWLFFSPFKFRSVDLKKDSRLLLINLGFIGDLLATTPLIKSLSKKFKKVDILVRKEMLDLLEGNPSLNEIIEFKDYRNLLIKIKNQYDCAIIIWPRNLKLTKTLISAGIRVRIGYTQPNFSLSSLFLTRNIFSRIHSHKVEQNLDSARLIKAENGNNGMEIFISKNEKIKPEKFLKNLGKYAIIHPGKRTLAGKNYLWTPERFAEVADYLIEKKKISVVIGGSAEDNGLAEKIVTFAKNKNKIINATGKFTLKEYAHLISKSQLLVSIDTSAIHFGACFNKKIVCLFCCYPEVWHPWENKKNYSLLFDKDLKNISSESVKNEINKLLK